MLGALAGFFLLPVPALFLVGPLAGELLLAGPRTRRERVWVIAGLAVGLFTLGLGPDTVAQRLVRAAGITFTGLFLALTVPGRLGGFSRAAIALGGATLAIAVGAALMGLEWAAVRLAVASQLHQAVEAVNQVASLSSSQRADLERAAEWMARIYPGIAAAGALAGGALAAALAHHVAAKPLGPPPVPFAAFRFSDHLIWGAVATLALALLPLPAPWADLVGNLLVVWVALYAARGAAVTVALAGRWRPGARVALFLLTVLLLPYAVGASLVIGLADTWLDPRRVLPPPSGGTNA